MLGGLTGSGWTALLEVQGKALLVLFVGAMNLQARGARLAVPAFEVLQLKGQCRFGIGVCNRLREIIASDCLSIVSLEIQRQALGETITPDQSLHHAHNFGTFFIDGDRVEIIDLHIGVWAYRVCHRTGIFGKLNRSQQPDVFNAFDSACRCTGGQILTELLVSEHRQTFFE